MFSLSIVPFFNYGHVLGFLDGLLMMVLWAGAGAADEAASDLQECPRARAPGGARARLTGRLIGAQSELRNIRNVESLILAEIVKFHFQPQNSALHGDTHRCSAVRSIASLAFWF